MAQVSRETGIPYPTVNRWWAERYLPDPAGLQTLIAVYGLNGHWVMTGDGNPDALVQQEVNRADMVESLAYQAGGRAALSMIDGKIEAAVAEAKKSWGTPADMNPDQIKAVKKGASRVAGHLAKSSKKGKAG